MNSDSRELGRRRLLTALAAGGAGLSLGALPVLSGLLSRRARADASTPRFFLFAYFAGGWDQLLALDPRDQTRPEFRPESAYGRAGSGIDPAYDRLTDPATQSVLWSNPSGVQQPVGSRLTFGPAVSESLLAHAADISIVRGVNMGTLTHEVGQRYFLTGRFPQGLQAAGSTLPTVIAAAAGDTSELPNLSVGVESYNDGLPSYASGIQVSTATDVARVLDPIGRRLPTASDAAVSAYEAAASSCVSRELDGRGLVRLFRESRRKVRDLVAVGASARFTFTLDRAQQTPEIRHLLDSFGIVTPADLSGPLGAAALAGQAFASGVSQAVSLRLASSLDHHDDGWVTDHAAELRLGFDALGKLIAFLKATPSAAGSLWDSTTLVCFSEFARTPLINGRGGRDHHLASSCLVAGPGIKGDRVIGATSDLGTGAQGVNLSTGAVDDAGGARLRPADVHATVLASLQLPTAHLSNQSPQIVTALLR